MHLHRGQQQAIPSCSFPQRPFHKQNRINIHREERIIQEVKFQTSSNVLSNFTNIIKC